MLLVPSMEYKTLTLYHKTHNLGLFLFMALSEKQAKKAFPVFPEVNVCIWSFSVIPLNKIIKSTP